MMDQAIDPARLDPTRPKDAHIAERLRESPIIWLSSVRPDGRPHVVPVWFLWDESSDTVLIFSKPDQKIRNLRQNNRVMVAVDDSRSGDDPIMLEGAATLLDPSTISTAYPAYVAKYATQLASYNWTGETMAREYSEPIRIQPTRFFR